MFWAIEASTMAHTENNNGKKTNETQEECEGEIECERIYWTQVFNLK